MLLRVTISEAGYASFDSDGAYSILPGGVDRLTITASSSTVDTYAYMDGSYNQVGGLGVCRALNGNCAGMSDDNQSSLPPEYIHMLFDNATVIQSLTIQGDHTNVIDGTWLNYSFNGIAQDAIDISGANLDIIMLAANSGTTALDYYITNTYDEVAYMYVTALTTVPLPAAALLFGTALIGLFGFGRRKVVEGDAIAA